MNNDDLRDALLRHGSVHGERAAEVRRQLDSQATRAAKACESCAKSKQQCRGGTPCARCTKRKIACRVGSPNSHVSDTRLEEKQATSFTINEAISDSELTTRKKPSEEHPETRLAHHEPFALSSNDFQGNFSIRNYLPSPNASAPDWYQGNEPAESTGITQRVTGTLDEGCVSFDNDFLPPCDNLNEMLTFGSSPLHWAHLDSTLFNDHFMYSNAQPQAPLPLNHEILLGTSIIAAPLEHINLDSFEPVTTSSRIVSQPRYNSPCFPELLLSDRELLARDNFCILQNVSLEAYTHSRQFFNASQHTATSAFPSIEVFLSFAELYFEFFNHDFSFVHPQQIEQDGASWILLVAVASVGAQYSSLSNAEMYVKCLQSLLAEAVEKNVRIQVLQENEA
jgi:hypothetical protein